METTTRAPLGGINRQAPKAPIKVRYCLYARKSTESEERQVLSIDSQIKEMLQLADKEGLEVVEMKRESHSAKETGKRPVFNEIVDELRAGKYNGILTWAADRISRNAGDLGKIVDLMDSGGLQEIRTYGQSFRNNPNEKFLLMILGSQAKLENDNRSVNIRRGMRMRCEMGLRPGVPPTGYLNEKHMERKCHAIIDKERAPIMKQVFERVANEHWSGRKIHQWLKFELNFKTKGNKHMSLGNIYVTLQNPFYYGEFEYPEKSGNWYQGKHEPIISKELFDKVQTQLKRDSIVRSEIKEFAFTKFMSCGQCSSGITADEKYKKLKDGTTARYAYYGCTRSKNLHCKNGYIREEELIEQLVKLIDHMDLNEITMQHKFEEEVKRLSKFQRSFFGDDKFKKHKGVELRDYAKYLLREGSVIEKRELLSCIKSRLILTRKVVTLEK